MRDPRPVTYERRGQHAQGELRPAAEEQVGEHHLGQGSVGVDHVGVEDAASARRWVMLATMTAPTVREPEPAGAE